MTAAWSCPIPGHDPTFVDEDGVTHSAVEWQGGVARCLRVGCDRTSADRPSFYGPGNPQCDATDVEGRDCVGPRWHPDGSDHANLYGSWPYRGEGSEDAT